jgi:predicted RNase H-like HicB family nuclease
LRFPDPTLAFQSLEIIVLRNQNISMGDIMAKRTFTVVIEKDPESGWLVGEVVELPGCYSQAPDIAGLEANIQEAIKAYLGAGIWEEPLSSFVGTWQVEVSA